MAQKPAHNFSVLLLRKMVQKKRVSMEERIEEFHSKNPGKEPCVLVDLMHIDEIQCGGRWIENRYRNICGPNLLELRYIEIVFNFLRARRCRLVFFVGGPDNRDLHEEQFSQYRTCRKDDRYARDIQLIDALKVDYRTALRAFKHIPTDRILFDSIVSMAGSYGSVVHALENPRSMEMARYVFDHPETLAVLGKSSSILLTADSPQLKLWYAAEMDANTMTVTELDSATVWSLMGLQSKEKRLLMAALLPGSYVGRHSLSEDVGKTHSIVHILPDNVGELQYKHVVKKLFAQTDTTWDQLKLACELYDVNQIKPSKQVDQRLTSYAYDIIHDRTSIITVMLNDYRYWSARNVDFYRLFVRFYSRLAGVVLKRSGAALTEEPTKRRIFIKRSHETGFERELVDVEFPDFDVASEKDGDSVTETNFKCLKFILNFEDMTLIERFVTENTNRLKLLDFVTVQYMIEESMLSQTLANMIMQTVEGNSEEESELPDKLDLDVFHATFMYVRWRCYVRQALVNAGFPDSFVDNMCRLDGSRLQVLAQRGSSDAEQENTV